MIPRLVTSLRGHRARWRPPDEYPDAPICGYRFGERTCRSRGNHYCQPRADKVVGFFADVLVHTKGIYARKAFVLDDWQEHGIVRPVFGEVEWSTEFECYVRRYKYVYIVLGRKNGKSEIAAGIVLYLLVADDEEGAEIYGAAKDTKQAGKVWQPAKRMVQLSPLLSRRLKVNLQARRIADAKTDSYYEVIPGADALGELGHNPHGVIIDEVLAQPDGELWNTLRTAEGTRTQALFLLITTETNDPNSFGAEMIDEAERIEADPSRSPHSFAYVRKTPAKANPWIEKTWYAANPALGSFLSVEAFRREALNAQNNPNLENSFRQYKLNQRVNAASAWLTTLLWQRGAGLGHNPRKLVARKAYGGLDLSATSDLTALAWAFTDRFEAGTGPVDMVWRYWCTEAAAPKLTKATGGAFEQWVRAGLVKLTEGDAIDYDAIHNQLALDAAAFDVQILGVDRWNSQATITYCDKHGIPAETLGQGYPLSPALLEIERLLKVDAVNHGGNPVSKWCAECTSVKRRADDEAVKLVKPDRDATDKRIDGIAAMSFAIDRWLLDYNTPSYDLASQVH